MADYAKLNRQKITAYIESGCKPSQKLGFELEHILLHKDTDAPVSYSERGGVRDILERLAPAYDRIMRDGDDIVGLQRSWETITIEPAAQLELSCGPFDDVEGIEQAYLDFRNRLDPILDEFGLYTPMLGYTPWACVDDLELIPKFRYECMTRFLGAQAHAGICMMRGSSALQISIDYEDETDAIRKMRVAQIIAPLLALICDNSPRFENAERPCNMVRTRIWADMNQDRAGTTPGSLKAGYSFDDYADYIMSREAILIPDAQEPDGWRYVGDKTFDQLYAGREMTNEEIEHAFSMVWPDARLKKVVEIRPADAMPIECCLAYAVIIRALFYSRRNLGILESMLADVDEDQVVQAKTALMEFGYDAHVYGQPASYWADLLIELADSALEPGEEIYLEPIASIVHRRFTLAEKWLNDKKAEV